MMKKKESIKLLLLFFTLLTCLLTKLISIIGFLIILGMFTLIKVYYTLKKNKNYPQYIYHILAFVISAVTIIIYQHLLPGFHNILILDKVQISKEAPLFTMYFNVDKALTGLVIFIFIVTQKNTMKMALKKTGILSY